MCLSGGPGSVAGEVAVPESQPADAGAAVADLLAEAALSLAVAEPRAAGSQPYESHGETPAEPPCLYREPKPSCGQTPGHVAPADTHEESAT